MSKLERWALAGMLLTLRLSLFDDLPGWADAIVLLSFWASAFAMMVGPDIGDD